MSCSNPGRNFFLALARHENRIMFSRHAPGQRQVSGEFPLEAQSADTLVFADYEFLSRTDFLRFAHSGRIGLLPPDPSLDASSVADSWVSTPESDRVHVFVSQLRQLHAFIQARAGLTSLMRQFFDSTQARLGEISPGYFSILSEKGQLIPEILPILRDYPTPSHLRNAGVIHLADRLQSLLPTRGVYIFDELLEVRNARPDTGASPLEMAVAEHAISGSINAHLQFAQQRADLDQLLYAHLSEKPPVEVSRPGRQPEVMFSAPKGAIAARRHPSMAGQKSSNLYERIDALLAKRFTSGRNPQSDYVEYLSLRSAIPSSPEPGDAADEGCRFERLRCDISGQLLSLGSGNLLHAIRYRADSTRILQQLELSPEEEPNRRVHADALLASALTETVAIAPPSGHAVLHAAIVENGASATPELLSEATSFYTMIRVLSQELDRHPEAISMMRETVAGQRGVGPARAAADITELLLSGTQPGTPSDRIAQLRAAADKHSRGTSYRSYYHLTLMLVALVTKDVEQGFLSYSEILREGIWQHHNPYFMRLSRAIFCVHLAARGELAAAWREIDQVRELGAQAGDESELHLYGLIRLRLELATSNYQTVIVETLPGSPYGMDRLMRLNEQQYVPASLMLRGSALMQDGAYELAIACFQQAAQQAALNHEWSTLLSLETHEFRAWLESLDREDLPGWLSRETYDGVLGQPVLIRHALPPVTPQHRKVLRYLIQGRSMNAIAAEMHISTNTLKGHLREIYRRLEVSTREQAAVKAEGYGVL